MSSFYYMPSVSHSTLYYISSEVLSRVICSQNTKISILVSVSEQVHDFALARHHYHRDLVQVSQVCAPLAQDRPPNVWILIVKTATEKIMPRIACSSFNRLTFSRAALDLCLALDMKLNIAPWVRGVYGAFQTGKPGLRRSAGFALTPSTTPTVGHLFAGSLFSPTLPPPAPSAICV